MENMFPVPSGLATYVDISKEKNPKYKSLLLAEYCALLLSGPCLDKALTFDPQERALARKACKESFAYWRKQGVRYMNIENEYEYSQQLSHYGEIID